MPVLKKKPAIRKHPRKVKRLSSVMDEVIIDEALKMGIDYVGSNPATIGGTGTFKYGYYTKNNKFVDSNYNPCHSALRNMVEARIIWTMTPRPSDRKKRDNVKLHSRYNEWLMNGSPWKDVPYKLDPLFTVEHGFLVPNTHLPSNLVANFCIATRMYAEKTDVVERWAKYSDLYIDPALALFISGGITHNPYDINNSKISWAATDPGHFPLNVASASADYVSNFVHHRTCNHLKPFIENANYTPCNTIWGNCSENKYDFDTGRYIAANNSYQKFIKDTYFTNDKPLSKRMFGCDDLSSSSNKLEGTEEQWIEVMQAETKRIKNEKTR